MGLLRAPRRRPRRRCARADGHGDRTSTDGDRDRGPAPPPAVIPGLPADLAGAWCSRVGPGECFDTARILAENPRAFVAETGPDPYVPGATTYTVCMEPETPNDCSVAVSMLIEYLPAGVEWDCEAIAQAEFELPDCEPDYSSAHDTSVPRLLHLFNHQQGGVYEDVPPLYSAGE